MQKIPFFQVDAFTDQIFSGNPAAICLLKDELDPALLQAIAAENNLSETAFISPAESGFNLRWFTPTVEVPLCGHATLATAHILWQEELIEENEPAVFHTLSGILEASKADGWISIDLPARSYRTVQLPEDITKALQVKPINTVYAFDRYVVELASAKEVQEIHPDMQLLKQHDMVVVTALGDAPYDFVSRSFGPSKGVNEDPVTGSSHCCLVPYYAQKLQKNHFYAYQASPRGGELRLKLEAERVIISGKAVTVIAGAMLIP